jgi:hypothetical protein
LVRIVVKTAVQPDPELSGQTSRTGCGELHPVRLSAGGQPAVRFTRSSLRLARTRLDSGLSLGYGF